MGIERIIGGCILGLIAIVFGIYVSFTVREKGPILSNTYMFSSKKERERIDKKAEYKLVSIVFGCLTISFSLLTLYTFTLWKWVYGLFWGVVAFVVVYAIIDAIKTIKKW